MKRIGKIIVIAVLFIVLLNLVLVQGLHFHEIEPENRYEISGISDKAIIAEKILDQYLKFYTKHGVKTRLSDYHIQNISLCSEAVNQKYFSTEQDGFVFCATFDVKPYFGTLFAEWYTGNGTNGSNGWCVDKQLYYKLTANGSAYILECIGTMY